MYTFPHVRSVLALASLLFCLGGCSSSSSPGDGSASPALNEQQISAQTGSGGFVQFSFSLPPGSASLQIVAVSPSSVLVPRSLQNSASVELLPLTTQTTDQARENSLSPSTLNAPFLGDSISEGTFTVQYQLSSNASGVTCNFSILSKSDTDLGSGTVRLNLVNVGPVANSNSLRSDLDAVLDIAKVIFDRAGISIDPVWYDFDGPELLPDPRNGDPLYQAISAAVRPHSVNMVFGSRVLGLRSDDRYAVAGAAPGPSTTSSRSAVVMDLIEVTGGDGEFQTDDNEDDRPSSHNDEYRLAAEELVRTVSNYLGLEDIVSFSGNRVVDSDALSDTDSCLTEEACEEKKDTSNNAMMPRPLRQRDRESSGRGFHPRQFFTDQQSAVLNNHVLVD